MPEDPLTSIRPSLQGIRFQVEQLLRARVAGRTNPPDARNATSQEVWGQIGGVLSRELLGAKRPGSKVARALVSSSQRAARTKAEEDARNQALFVLQQLAQSLDLVDSILEPRFRQSVRRVLAEASSAHRPESILRRILQITSRLETYRPPVARIVKESPYPEVLRKLESGLRRVIVSRLSALTPNWWAERVPEEVRSKAERWKANRERVWPWLDGGEHPVEEYLGFPDYAKIIFEPHNWEQAFSTVFVEAEPLRVKLRELEPIRTDIAHSRRLTQTNRRRLETYADDILTVIDTE